MSRFEFSETVMMCAALRQIHFTSLRYRAFLSSVV